MRFDNEKKFFFFGEKEKTNLGFVYIPGFSATRREISPVVENLANDFKGHLFMSRLTGHGQTAEEFQSLRAENFLSDGLEAVAVSQVLSKKKIWIATSTGALVVLWIASHYPKDVSAMILVSPAFDIKPARTRLLAGHWGKWFGQILVGPYRQWTPLNQEQEKYWHTRYRTEGLTALTRLIAWNKDISFSSLKIPTLIFYNPDDQVVEVPSILRVFEQLGSPQKKLVSVRAKDHVLAGDVTSPETNELVQSEMARWLKTLSYEDQ